MNPISINTGFSIKPIVVPYSETADDKLSIQELVATNSYERVNQYFEEGGDPQVVDNDGKNLLFFATSDQMLDLLLRANLHPEQVSTNGKTAWIHWLLQLTHHDSEQRAAACSLITQWLKMDAARQSKEWKRQLKQLEFYFSSLIAMKANHEIRWIISAAIAGGYLFENIPGIYSNSSSCFGFSLLIGTELKELSYWVKMGSLDLSKPNKDGCTPFFHAVLHHCQQNMWYKDLNIVQRLKPLTDLNLTLPKVDEYLLLSQDDMVAYLLAAWDMASEPNHLVQILDTLAIHYKDSIIPVAVLDLIACRLPKASLAIGVLHVGFDLKLIRFLLSSGLHQFLNVEDSLALTHDILFKIDLFSYNFDNNGYYIVTEDPLMHEWLTAHSALVNEPGSQWLLQLSESVLHSSIDHVKLRHFYALLSLARFLGRLPDSHSLEDALMDSSVEIKLIASLLLSIEDPNNQCELLRMIDSDRYSELLLAAVRSPLKKVLLSRMIVDPDDFDFMPRFPLNEEQINEIVNLVLREPFDIPIVYHALRKWLSSVVYKKQYVNECGRRNMKYCKHYYLYFVPLLPLIGSYCIHDYLQHPERWGDGTSSLPVHRCALALPISSFAKKGLVKLWNDEETKKLWDLAAPDIILSGRRMITNGFSYEIEAVKKNIDPQLTEEQRLYLASIVEDRKHIPFLSPYLGDYAPFVKKEAFEYLPNNKTLSILLYLSLQKKPDGTPLLHKGHFLNTLKEIKDIEAEQMCEFLFSHPQLLTQLTEILTKENRLEIKHRGQIDHTYHCIASSLLWAMQTQPHERIIDTRPQQTELGATVVSIMNGKSRVRHYFSPLLRNIAPYTDKTRSWNICPIGAQNRQEVFFRQRKYEMNIQESERFSGIVSESTMCGSKKDYHANCLHHFLMMEELAELMLSHSLSLVEKIEQEGKTNWEDLSVVEKLAREMKDGHTSIVQAASGKSIDECLKFSEEGPFNWIRMAKQLLFWLQNDDAGYLGALKRGKLPRELYPLDVEIDLENIRNYTPESGFTTNGNKDLGPVLGPLCLTEFEKMAYATTILILGLSVARMQITTSVNL